MRSDRQAARGAGPRSGSAGNRATARFRPSLGHMAVLAILATSFALAPAAHATSADRSGEVPAVHPPDVAEVVEIVEERTTALFVDEPAFESLPFARLDLAIMVLGSVILAMAAVGVPLILSPLRFVAPAHIRLRRASGRLSSSGDKGGPAHAPA